MAEQAVEYRLKEAVETAVAGSDWSPPEGAILTECVVLMGWYYADGTYGSSHLTCGPPWAGHGLVTRALHQMELRHEAETEQMLTDEDDA